MTAPLEIIERACRLARLAAEQQPVDPYKIERGRECYNDIIREWGNSENYIPLQSYKSLNLVQSQQKYTIGLNDGVTTYDLNTQPIINILECNIIDPDSNPSGYFKCEVITEFMYSNIFFRNSQGIPGWVLVRLYPMFTELYFQVPPFKNLTALMLCKQQLQPVSNTEMSVVVGAIPGFAVLALQYQIAQKLMIMFGKPATSDFLREYDRAIDSYLANNIGVDPYVKKDVTLNNRSIYTSFTGLL